MMTGNDRGTGLKAKKIFKLPAPKEAEVLSNVKKVLDIFKAQGLLTYRRIHCMPVIRNGKYTANNEMSGMEDIQIYLMHGKMIFLELKSEKGKLSELQEKRRDELLALGHDYWCCSSIDSFIAGLRQRGLSCWSFPI